ncbi:uncharacterized protein [Heliangelus exortis]|uniref:uncharacterized protein n=1 Tax=Heliangelus exortis TaxID=472823 RepID=UPI003A93F8BC
MEVFWGGSLVSLSLRPTGTCGEGDPLLAWIYWEGKARGWLPHTLPPNTEHGRVYVGNVSWLHLLAACSALSRPELLGGKFFFCSNFSPFLPYDIFNFQLLGLPPGGSLPAPFPPPPLGPPQLLPRPFPPPLLPPPHPPHLGPRFLLLHCPQLQGPKAPGMLAPVFLGRGPGKNPEVKPEFGLRETPWKYPRNTQEHPETPQKYPGKKWKYPEIPPETPRNTRKYPGSMRKHLRNTQKHLEICRNIWKYTEKPWKYTEISQKCVETSWKHPEIHGNIQETPGNSPELPKNTWKHPKIPGNTPAIHRNR